MAWTSPKTWALNELLTSADMNTYLTDNTAYLYDTLDGALTDITDITSPPTSTYILNETADYTTTSTSFVNVDDTNLALTITTGGGDVLIWFQGMLFTAPNRSIVYFDVDIDGSRVAGDHGIIACPTHYVGNSPTLLGNGGYGNVSFVYLATGLTAGSHTFKLQWFQLYGGYTAYLYSGAGSNGGDLHPQFGVREIT